MPSISYGVGNPILTTILPSFTKTYPTDLWPTINYSLVMSNGATLTAAVTQMIFLFTSSTHSL
jgi:hypothetical protein